MRVSRLTFLKLSKHLFFTGLAFVCLGSVTYADSSPALTHTLTMQSASHGQLHGTRDQNHTAGVSLIRYEGYSSAHGSPHHGKGHAGHGFSPHGAGHSGGFSMGHGGAHGSSHPGPHQSASEFIDHVLRFKEGMGITDKQEATLRSLETNFKKTRIQLKAEGDLANLELHELLRDENTSLSKIEAKLKSVHALKADLYMASIKARRDAKAVLTDEQRSRMKTIHERIKMHGSKMKNYSGGKSPHGNMSKPGG